VAAAQIWTLIALLAAAQFATFVDMRRQNDRSNDRFDALRAEIAQLRGEFAQLRGEFGELRGEFGELRGELGELRGEFAILRHEVHEHLMRDH
jgi:predicted nuclease with TOPRIM domain